jgi:hypothetical protein
MRHYTVDEADALIPTLSPVLEDLHDLHLRLQEAREVVEEFQHLASQNGNARTTHILDPDVDMSKLQSEMRKRLEFLTGLDVVLKDIEIGLIDFPTRLHDHDVYLCWHLGEERVGFWHEIEEGYRGRRPLP